MAGTPPPDTEEAARAWVALGKEMLSSGKISATESVIFLTYAVEGIHTTRWLDGAYRELEPFSLQMERIEREAGLRPEQYWKKGDAPENHQRLSDMYEAVLDAKFEEMLREFDLPKLADLWRDDRPEYDRLREIGRRSIFEKDNHLKAVTASIPLYEDEAVKSAAAGAFYAATVMLGSAAEARLIERFLSYPAETSKALASMAGASKPRNTDPLHWSLEHMLAVAEQAGWLGVIEDDYVGANVRLWLLSLRDTRNLLHPGRHVRDKPHIVIGNEEFLDAKFGYGALCIALLRSSPTTPPAHLINGLAAGD